MAVEIREPVLVDVTLVDTVEWNPNEESEAMFGQLVQTIREQGFKHPIDIVPRNGRYVVIAGEHRLKAAMVVGLTKVPAYVDELTTDEEMQIRSIRDNVVRGNVNAAAFTRLYDKMAHKFGADQLRRMMGLTEDAAFRRLHKNVARHLPPEVRKRLRESEKEVATVDDLARVLQSIMATAGSTVGQSFVVFSFGGRDHVLVRCEKRTWDNLRRIGQECAENDIDMNVRMNQLLEQYIAFE